jgi:uncharacterized protein (TIGR02246 family)
MIALIIIKWILIIIAALCLLVTIMGFIKVGTYPDIQEAPLDMEFRKGDTLAIQSLVDTMVKAWGAADGKLYASVFTDTLDYIAFNGERYITKQQNEEVHQKLFDTVLKGSSLVGQKIIGLRYISDDVAVVITTGFVKTRFVKKPPKSRASIQTLVAKKESGVWRFTSFQNSRISQFTMGDGIKMIFS